MIALLVTLAPAMAQQASRETSDESTTVRVVITERLLCRPRTWTTVDGSTVTGALIAHREADSGNNPPPSLPVTVVKDDRIRLRIGWGTYNLPLEKFSQKDRQFVRQLEQALEQRMRGERAASPTQPTTDRKAVSTRGSAP